MNRHRLRLLAWVALSISAAMVVRAYDLVELTPANHEWRPASAHLTLGQVARIAEATALKQGVSLANFLAPRFHYAADTKRPVWTAFYEGKSGRPGDHFFVSVDDRTGSGTFMPGE
jgi:hypothetical protein